MNPTVAEKLSAAFAQAADRSVVQHAGHIEVLAEVERARADFEREVEMQRAELARMQYQATVDARDGLAFLGGMAVESAPTALAHVRAFAKPIVAGAVAVVVIDGVLRGWALYAAHARTMPRTQKTLRRGR